MFWLNVALIITFFFRCTFSALPLEKPVPMAREFTLNKTSDGSNIINLDLLDDSSFDFHFDSPCPDCKCFINPPILDLQNLKTASLSPKSIKSYVDSNQIIVIQQTDLNDISYSMYNATSDSLIEIQGNTMLDDYKEAKHIIYSPHEKVFVGFTEDNVYINKLDDYGNLKKTAYKHSQIGEYFDMVFGGGMLFIAKGELGIEVLDFYEDLSGPHIESYVLPIEELELPSGYKVTKLAIDYARRALYAYEPHSDHDFLLALDLTNREEISIANNYKFNFTNIIDFIPADDDLHILYSHRDNYYYTQLTSVGDVKYAEYFPTKLWKMPVKMTRLARNDNKVLIQGEKYIYSFKNEKSYGENTQAFVDIISAETQGDFFSYKKGGSVNIIAISESQIALSSINRPSNPTIKCGVFRKDYEGGKEEFNILVLKSTCPEKEAMELPVCVYFYRYELIFNIDSYSPAHITPLAPQARYRTPEEENNIIDSSPQTPPTNPIEEEEEEESSDEPRPNEPIPDDPKTNEPIPGSDEPYPDPSEEEEINQHHHGTDGGQSSPGTEHSDGTDSEEEEETDGTDEPEPIIDIKKPDLIDPDAPYYDKVQNMYALVLVGIIVVTCFGCLVKCLCDFTRNQARIEGQFKHKQLDEEEEEDSEIPGVSGNSKEEQNSET